jgi:hypothetical protein
MERAGYNFYWDRRPLYFRPTHDVFYALRGQGEVVCVAVFCAKGNGPGWFFA